MASVDDYAGTPAFTTGADFPANDGEAVTKSDTVFLTKTSRALYIGGTGDVTVLMRGGSTLTFTTVPVGILPIRVQRVNSTGTSATNIVAIY